MGDRPAPSEDAGDRSEAPPRKKDGQTAPETGTRPEDGSAREQARIDREAGDVADDLADFA